MRPRDPDEPNRAASPLELFFDLVFVVAVALSSQTLHHLYADGHLVAGAVAYLMVFFAIWWAWMNFTWFATSFATDDWLYRITTFVQMGGVLLLAAGAEAAMTRYDFTLVTIGYVIMRMAVVGQWMRARRGHHDLRATASRFAVGICALQAAWVARLFLPPTVGLAAFVVLVAAELSVPVWAETRGNTPWNRRHIAERYGLFTLILLGESILASTNAVVEALHPGEHVVGLALISAAGLSIAAGLWWVYFAAEHSFGQGLRSSLLFGYFHYAIFAAAGAFSAGVEMAIDVETAASEIAREAAIATLAVPVAVFLVCVWWLTLRERMTAAGVRLFAAGLIVVAASIVLPGPPLAWATLGIALAILGTEVGVADRHAGGPGEVLTAQPLEGPR